MPRKPDPALEEKIIDAAVQLLDSQGMDAITMREVAKAARTTTPTIYERFRDHEAILWAVFQRVRLDLLPRMEKARTLPSMADDFLQYVCDHPQRLELLHRVWPPLLGTNEPQPIFELAIRRLRNEYGHSPKKAEEISFALITQLLGTAILMLGAGLGTASAKAIQAAGQRAYRRLAEGI